MTNYVADTCYKCDILIMVPVRDHNPNRNLCQICAWSYAGAVPNE